jgi:hypothetical protein
VGMPVCLNSALVPFPRLLLSSSQGINFEVSAPREPRCRVLRSDFLEVERSRRARLKHHMNNSSFTKAYYLGFPSSHSPVRTRHEKRACLYSECVAPTESTRPNRTGVDLVILQPPRPFDLSPSVLLITSLAFNES